MEGNLLMQMDAPNYSWKELVQLTETHDTWRQMVQTVKGSRVHVDMRQYPEMK